MFVAALVFHYSLYPLFVIESIPALVLVSIGMLSILIGLAIWVSAAKAIDSGLEEERLITQGVYAFFRHPIYSQAILFTIPGVALLFRSWLLLSVPVSMYILFRFLIRKEEDALRARFGRAYAMYQRDVNAVFPKVWKVVGNFFYPVPTGRVMKNVWAVRDRDANVFVYTDGEHAVAIDAGRGCETLRREFDRLPIGPDAVTHLFLTHSDHDHTGGVKLFRNAHIYLGQGEENMIDGTRARLFWFYKNPKIGRPYDLVSNGDTVTVGTIRVRAIATPGHTPGSMVFLINETVLFTGDTLTLQNGRVRPFYRLFNMDTSTQRVSIRRLARLDVALVCTAHTGCTTDYDRAMEEWRSEMH